MLAPIAMFVYNRPWHTQRTIETLQKNIHAQKHDLFIFSDAPKNQYVTQSVEQTRNYVRSIYGFKSVTIIERVKNFGLANSIITGITEIFNRFDRVIVVEDDLLTAPCFLTFMNEALECYGSEESIFSVSGFNFPIPQPQNYPFDAFFSYRSMSWGWGTWKNRWERADWEMSDYSDFKKDPQAKNKLNRGGEDLLEMLDLQMEGKLDSWSIRWDYLHSKNDAMALMPVQSMVFNIGFDGTGVHCGTKSIDQSPLPNSKECRFSFPPVNHVEPYFIREIQSLHKITPLKKLKSLIQKLRRIRHA